MPLPLVFAMGLLLGAAVGALGAWWLQHQSYQKAEQERQRATLESEHLREKYDEHYRQLEAKKQEYASLQEENTQLQNQLSALRSQQEAERKAHQEKLQTLEEAEKRLNQQFENTANRILEQTTKNLRDTNQQQLGEILRPLQERIGEFRQRVEQVYENETKERVSLREQLQRLQELNQQLSQDAINLTEALKGESKTQGNWGELVIRRLLEAAGLQSGREFEEQVALEDPEGHRYIADVLVHLPEARDIIIDSKVSLTAYERYHSAATEEEQQQALKEHLQSVENHLQSLSEKRYDRALSERQLDFVLMCIPVEPAFLKALEERPQLLDRAARRHVIITGPSTLLLALRIVAEIWRREDQDQNAQEIARKGGELYDKFVGLLEAIDDVGRHLERLESSYATVRNRLSEGRGNLLNRAEQLRKLGAQTQKGLPQGWEEALADPEVAPSSDPSSQED